MLVCNSIGWLMLQHIMLPVLKYRHWQLRLKFLEWKIGMVFFMTCNCSFKLHIDGPFKLHIDGTSASDIHAIHCTIVWLILSLKHFCDDYHVIKQCPKQKKWKGLKKEEKRSKAIMLKTCPSSMTTKQMIIGPLIMVFFMTCNCLFKLHINFILMGLSNFILTRLWHPIFMQYIALLSS